MGISEEMLLNLGVFPIYSIIYYVGYPKMRRESFIGKMAKKAHKK